MRMRACTACSNTWKVGLICSELVLTGSVRRTLEAEVKQARPYRTASGSVTTIQAASSGATGSTSPVGSAHGSKSSLSSNGKRDSAVNGVPIARASTDHLFKATSKGSPSTSSASKTSHRRSTSVLSLSAKPTNDEFDALLRSGETMHISLTPSRFGTFEVGCSFALEGLTHAEHATHGWRS